MREQRIHVPPPPEPTKPKERRESAPESTEPKRGVAVIDFRVFPPKEEE